MHIHALYTHPIKSLRPISLEHSALGALGLAHDRRFLLQRLHPSPTSPSTSSTSPSPTKPPENLHISHYPELCLFHLSFSGDSLVVNFIPGREDSHDSRSSARPAARSLTVPLYLPTEGLEKVQVNMHGAGCVGWTVDGGAGAFFTACLGFPARLVYLADSTRPVLGNVAPVPSPSSSSSSSSSWVSVLGTFSSFLGSIAGWQQGEGESESEKKKGAGISFADCAPLLVATLPSLADVSRRLPDGETMDMTKFRPNIVLAPDADDDADNLQPWAEDFWAELLLTPKPTSNSNSKQEEEGRGKRGGEVRIQLTANCGRCPSINVDYETGGRRPNDRQPLKLLMKDRRVDPGMAHSPIFGRYGFVAGLDGGGSDDEEEWDRELSLNVGDVVRVVKKNQDRTVFYWPGVSTGTRVKRS